MLLFQTSREMIFYFQHFIQVCFYFLGKKTGGARPPLAPPLATALLVCIFFCRNISSLKSTIYFCCIITILPNFRSSKIDIKHLKNMTHHLNLQHMFWILSIHLQLKDFYMSCKFEQCVVFLNIMVLIYLNSHSAISLCCLSI